jgi:hypothetical protein
MSSVARGYDLTGGNIRYDVASLSPQSLLKQIYFPAI